MQNDFILRANIARYQMLLAGGQLNTGQAATIRRLLERERTALAARPDLPRPGRGRRPAR